VVTGGLVLAEAAALHENKNVVMTQAYHPQQRGGPARAEIIISDGDIDYPKVLETDVLLALNQDAYDRYHHQMKRNGVIIVESTRVGGELAGHVKVFKVPLEEISEKASGSVLGANLVALGIISGLRGIVGSRALQAAIKSRMSQATMVSNAEALKAGLLLGRSMRKGKTIPDLV
jgi:2-oxoglutarate ferredoxin oxidoreductase subunit gamma